MRWQTKYPNVVCPSNGLTAQLGALLKTFNAGDIINLNGELVRITKRTNYAIAYEPYTLWSRIEEAILQFLGAILP